MPPNAKIKTYSFDQNTLDKLDKLTDLMHITNKSRILSLLIAEEYNRRANA